MNQEHTTSKGTTLEKAEQLLVLLRHDPELAQMLKSDDENERDALLMKVGLTSDEIESLIEEANNLGVSSAKLVGW